MRLLMTVLILSVSVPVLAFPKNARADCNNSTWCESITQNGTGGSALYLVGKVIEQQEARIAALERGRGPVMSSLFSGGLGGGMALTLLPLALFVALRKRSEQRNR